MLKLKTLLSAALLSLTALFFAGPSYAVSVPGGGSTALGGSTADGGLVQKS